jgi:hypothetical protein
MIQKLCSTCLHMPTSTRDAPCKDCLRFNEANLIDNWTPQPGAAARRVDVSKPPEYTGGSVGYYQVKVTAPTSGGDAYTAECNDIIEALGMNYAEGNAFKAIWRRCAARTLGKTKAGYKDGLYDAEKVVFFGERMVAQEKKHG